MVNLFHVAVAKKKVPLIQQLLPYQNLSDKEKFSLIYQFMHTSHNFVLLLLKEINNKEHIQRLLYKAVLHNHVCAVQILLEKGAQPNIPNRFGQLPIHLAFSPERKEIIKLLLKYGADVNGKNKWNHTPLYLAAWHGHIQLMNFLEENGAFLNKDVLRAAACANQFEAVDYLLKRGLTITDEIYFKVMMANRQEMATYLFERDPYFQLTANPDYQILAIAIYKNYRHLVKKMIYRGLPDEHDARRIICSTALFAAIDSGQFYYLPLLVKNGADINYFYENETPLDAAIMSGNTTIIKWIKEQGGTRSKIRKIYR